MLNQRRHTHEIKEDDERESLLGTLNHSSNNVPPTALVDGSQLVGIRQKSFSNPPIRHQNVHSNRQLLYGQVTNDRVIEVPTTVPLPVQRKTRDRTPSEDMETNYRLIERQTTSSSSSAIAKQNLHHQLAQGDSIEFGVSDNSYYRAIDLSSSNNSHVNTRQTTDFIYYTVQPGDTLQNLSIKYSCSVASIKRLNNLWSDREIHGLTTLKLPVGKLRLIEDVLSAENRLALPTPQTALNKSNQELSSSQYGKLGSHPEYYLDTNDNAHHSENMMDDECNSARNSNLDILNSLQSQLSSESIFKDYDLNIEKARIAARSYNENASEIMQSLAQSGNIVDEEDPNLRARREAESLLNDMSDYGLSYNGLILFMFIVCLICPLAFVIYLDETHRTKHPD